MRVHALLSRLADKAKSLFFAMGFAAPFMAWAGSASAAEPTPWQLGLQPAAGTIAEKATDLLNLLLVIITAISLFVLALLRLMGLHPFCFGYFVAKSLRP